MTSFKLKNKVYKNKSMFNKNIFATHYAFRYQKINICFFLPLIQLFYLAIAA